MRKILALAAAGTALAIAPAAHAADTETATASVEILPTITLTKSADLNFGTIAVNGAGTASIAATASATPNCSANLVCAGTGGGAAVFSAAGTADVGFSASVSTAPTALVGQTDNSVSIPIGSFSVGYDATKGQVLVGGSAPVYVGATLTFAGTETAQTYSADFDVTAEYQ